MKNEQIKSFLLNRRDEYERVYEALPKKVSILEEVYLELDKFNFKEYKYQLEKEIRNNLKEWWINPEKGIKREEELFAILFEYGHFFKKGVEAESYGIGKWEDYKEQTEEFDMGFNYDFTTEFYAAPGLTLNFFDSLEKLDYSNLREQYSEDEIDGFEGFGELIHLHKFNGMIAVQEVFQKMENNKAFEELNYKNNFMFIIDEHDSSEVYPLLIKEKK
jgi:hypothetical protein